MQLVWSSGEARDGGQGHALTEPRRTRPKREQPSANRPISYPWPPALRRRQRFRLAWAMLPILIQHLPRDRERMGLRPVRWQVGSG